MRSGPRGCGKGVAGSGSASENPDPARATWELLAAEEAVLDLRKEGGARDDEDENREGCDLSQGGTSFLEVEVLEGFGRLAIERSSTDRVFAG